MAEGLFKLRGQLAPQTVLTIQVVGAVVALALWQAVAQYGGVNRSILPTPWAVATSYGDLLERKLAWHTWQSVKLNFLGYLEAVAVCLPLGILLGIFPLPRALFERLLSALRFLPLPAAMGLFIAAFGIGGAFKVHFLAVGIAVYLLATVMQRVQETPEVYDQTVRTLGASPWQRLRHVFVPDVASRGFEDVRVLVALSWTYITLTETINSSAGGLGALAELSRRQSHAERVYAILVLVIAIGWVQDWTFKGIDRLVFRFKYA